MVLKEKIKNIDFRFVISCIAAWALLLMFFPKNSVGNNLRYVLNDNNLIYAIGEKMAYNSSLFHGNIYMGEGVISPRYVIDIIFSILMYVNGGDWASAALIWIYFGVFIQALGIATIAKRSNERYQIVFSVVLTFLIAYCNNYLASFRLIQLETIGMGTALAFAFLGISFLVGKEREYNKAWIFAACAAVCHIHEGIYCCVVIFLFAVVDSFLQKRILWKENKMILLGAAAVFAVALPSILTDSMTVSDAEFVQIYAALRHPHHLLPSAWGIDSICKTVWIDCCLFMLSMAAAMKLKSKKVRFYLYEAIVLMMTWVAVLCLMYVFTELKPIASVSTIFGSKFFKYVLLIALIWLVQMGLELRDYGAYITSYLFLFFALFASGYELPQIYLMAVLIFAMMQIEDHCIKTKASFMTDKAVIWIDFFFAAFAVFIICAKRSLLRNGRDCVLIVVVVAVVIVISFALKRKFRGYQIICAVMCLCILGCSCYGRIFLYHNGRVSLIDGEAVLKASMGNELYELAEEFRGQTDVTEEFLADPEDAISTGWFQVVSERNCYVVYKVIPSSKSTVGEWYDRYLQTTPFDEKTNDEIKEVMASAGIEYVLMDADNYSKLDGTEEFSVFMSSPKDSYRIYKLNQGDGSL